MMNIKRYRSKKETVDLFLDYANYFEVQARECEKRNNHEMFLFYSGKAEAYETAAFELMHNME